MSSQDARVVVACPTCGSLRTLTKRNARRKVAPCMFCRYPAIRSKPSDTERRYMLQRLSDDDILEAAEAIWGEAGSAEILHQWREHLEIPEPGTLLESAIDSAA